MDKLKKSSGNTEKHLKKLRKGDKIVVTVSGNVEKTCQKRRKLRKEKNTEYKKEMREKGVIKSISNLSNRQQYIRRKQWKKDSRNYRKRKSLQQAKETRVGSRGSPRIQSGRKAAKHIYSSLRYKLQSMIAKSLKQARKIENLRKENYCLKSKDKSKCSLSPATKVRKLIGRKKMSPEIRKNLLLNFAFMSGLEENKKVFKKEKERRLFATRVSNKIIKKYQMIGQLKNLTSNKNYKKALETKKMHFKRSYKGQKKKRKKKKNRRNSFSDKDSDSNNPPANAIKNIFQNDYVVIKLAGKKSVRFYVGVIFSQDAFDEYTVKFMRKCGKDKFTFPENDDIAELDSSNIVNVLSQPSLNKREQYVFNENLEHYNLT
ncbi:hypothetical protein AVEN_260070-1 [Araneus ventricosus]|uniref:Uncharacterized protein n=1 Tax=Araneus ventricosus TaxID=182803 RepID=A0A4Y2G4R1_ARAVE|nr:hypothetical protein AVEN_260070-1 [Araneus ventricosus]